MNEDVKEKPKNETHSQPNIVINNNSGDTSGFQIKQIIVIAFVGMIVGIGFRQLTDFSSFVSWWTQPAPLNIPANVYVPEVQHIRSMAELTTTTYNYANVTTGQREVPRWLSNLYGDSVAMVVVGTIQAGIDISLIEEEDVTFDEETQILSITLPRPMLQNCFLDERKSYVVQRDTGIFADTMDNLEDDLRQGALLYFRDQALEEGILEDAMIATETALSSLLSINISSAEVVIAIDFHEPAEEVILPDTCQ